MTSIEKLTLKNCLKRKVSKACDCQKENEKFKYPADTKKIEEKIQKKIAQETFQDLQKSLVSISNKILTLDRLGHNSEPMQKCSLPQVRNLTKNCASTSLYKYLKDDPKYSFDKLYEDTKSEVESQLQAYNPEDNFLYPKNKYGSPSCNISNQTTNKIFGYSKDRFLKEAIQKISPISPDSSIYSQLLSFSESNADADGLKVLQKLNVLLKDPHYYEFLQNQHPQTLGDLANTDELLKKNITNLEKNLKVECKKIYNLAKTSLCAENSQDTAGSYKDLRTVLKKEDDPISKSAVLTRYCSAISNPSVLTSDFIKYSFEKDLPPYLKGEDINNAIRLSFAETQNEVREEICDFIPPNMDVSKSLEDCPPEDETNKCEYLRAYQHMMESEFKRAHPESEFKNLAHEDGTKYTEEEIKAEKEKRKVEFTASFNGAKETLSPLMSNFLYGSNKADGESTNVVVNNKTSNTSTTGNSNNTGDNNNKVKTASLSGGNVSTGNGKKKVITHNQTGTNGSGEETNTSTGSSSNYIDDMNNFYNSQQDIKKEIARRIFKKKKKGNAFDDIGNNPTYMARNKKKLTHKQKKERKKLLEQFKEDYINTGSSSIAENNLETQIDDEYLKDQQRFDESFGSASRRPAGIAGSGGRSNGPGYFKNSITGEVVKTPTVAMNSIPNSGFAGTGINSGNHPLEELTQITLYGTLAEDLSLIDPSTVEVLDSNSSKLAMQINSLVQNKEPFVIKNQYEDGQKILVKFNEFGGYNLFVKDENSGKYKPATEMNFNNNKYEAFYKNVQKAFNQNFIAKFTK